MAGPWYRLTSGLCARLYFHRITLLGAERLPRSGPALYLGLHRNGAVDAFLYHGCLPRATFMISTQLRRNPIGRLFFSGIEVVRGKDEGDRAANAGALAGCRDLLAAGGELFVFPEGTSTLGPRHLPFKSGAARILLEVLDAGGPAPTVIPLAIAYERAWSFRSNVEVAVGPAVALDLPAGLDPAARLAEVRRRLDGALEAVGVNVDSAEVQERNERLAYVATLGTTRSYYRTLKALERGLPDGVAAAERALAAELEGKRLLRHQGVPLVPMGPVLLYAAALLLLGPIVAAAGAVNAPPLVAGWWAGRAFPDDRNVIALWRILVGVPLFVLWVLALGSAAAALGHLPAFALYLAVTGVGLASWYRVRKLFVAVVNGLAHPDVRPHLLAFRATLLGALPDDGR